MSTVAVFVRRKLNRTKAALLLLEAQHIGVTPNNAGCPICGVVFWSKGEVDCPRVRSLRKVVAAGEIALKQAEAMR